jgi:hypothetical protein
MLKLGEGHQVARCQHVHESGEDWGVPPAHQHGLAPLEPSRIRPTDGQRRDVVQRGRNGQ